MATVLRAFDYSFDGVTALKAKIGDDIDFRDMTAGLVAEGYVEVGSFATPDAPPEPAVAVDVALPPEPETPQVEPVADVEVQPEVATPEVFLDQVEPAVVAEPAPKTRKRK